MAAKGPQPPVPGDFPSGEEQDEPDHLHCGGIRLGQMQMRQGLLCNIDDSGRSYYRAPRRADVRMAQRVVAAVESSDLGPTLAADVIAIRER